VYADEEGEGGTAKDTIDSICDTAGEGDIFWESGDTFGCQWGGQGGAGVTCTAVEGGATCCASSGPGDPNLSCWTENDWQIATPGRVKALEAKLKALREASKSTDPRVLAPRPMVDEPPKKDPRGLKPRPLTEQPEKGITRQPAQEMR